MTDITAPLVSICIPTYNAENTLQEMLTSIIGQTYRNLDIQIVDNASIDRTLEIAAAFNDSRISIVSHDKNIGAEGNFNRCIALGRGKYTAIFHADDIYETDMVRQQVDFLECHPEAGAVFTEAGLIDENGDFFGALRMPAELSLSDLYRFDEIFKVTLHRRNFLVCPSAMVLTTVYQNHVVDWRGQLFKSSADLDVWLRIAKKYPVGVIRTALMRYRVSKFQFSALVRSHTERADFFLVTEHYLEKKTIRDTLSKRDLRHYRWLERTDNVRRALNLFALGETARAELLCDGAISLDGLRAALDGRLGILTLLAALGIKLCKFTGLQNIGRSFLKKCKK